MNKIFLMGRLTKDIDLRFTANNNTPVCAFTLAVNRQYTRKNEAQKADYFSIIAWRSQAEFCAKYFRKGMRVVVEGRVETRTWDDEHGKRHYITEVIAELVHFADGKRDNAQPQLPAQGQLPTDGDGFYSLDDEDDLPF